MTKVVPVKSKNVWSKAHDRLQPEVWPVVEGKLPISSDCTIFTIGSCFARNIEQHLKMLGYNVPLLEFTVPKTEWTYGSNSILNNYTPASIYQEIKWLADIHSNGGVVTEADVLPLAFEAPNGFVDLQIRGQVPVEFARLIERRQQIYDVSKCIFSAELVVITLGLIEVWQDVETGRYLQESPANRALLRDKKRFKPSVLKHDECLKYIDDAITLVKERNPNASILITTSPIPLARTFTQDDVITANMHSKAKLRSVCGELAASGKATYFPSFESAILTKNWDIWQEDLIHIKSSFVGKIINKLTNSLFDVQEDLLLYQKTFSGVSVDEGITLIERAIALRETPEYLHRWGELLEAQGRPEDAKDAYVRSLTLGPDNWAAYFRIAVCELKLKNLDQAFVSASKAAELAPSDQVALFRLMHQLHMQNGDEEQALAAQRKVYELSPDLVHFEIENIRELKKSGRATEALNVAKELLILKDDHPALHIEMGHLYRLQGEIEKSKGALEQAISLDPQRPEPYIQLSHVCRAQGNLEAAIGNMNKAISRHGGNRDYYNHLANLLQKNGDMPAANAARAKANSF